jgi:hypothetical protein
LPCSFDDLGELFHQFIYGKVRAVKEADRFVQFFKVGPAGISVLGAQFIDLTVAGRGFGAEDTE